MLRSFDSRAKRTCSNVLAQISGCLSRNRHPKIVKFMISRKHRLIYLKGKLLSSPSSAAYQEVKERGENENNRDAEWKRRWRKEERPREKRQRYKVTRKAWLAQFNLSLFNTALKVRQQDNLVSIRSCQIQHWKCLGKNRKRDKCSSVNFVAGVNFLPSFS